MAKIFPFRALRYNPAKVAPEQVVTQPYDKITPEMQSRYYAASPYNLVRVILGKQEANDSGTNNVYTRAAAHFAAWRVEHVLLPDSEPALYLYTQTFTRPDGGASGETYERRGFIAAGQLEEYDAQVVHRHEQTLSKPKADRLNLLRATQAHFGQIFMLYSDPADEVFSAMRPDSKATVEVRDEYGVLHRVWRVSDPAIVSKVQSLMHDKKLIIADGHHRYETALNYRNERRASNGHKPDGPCERVMMTLVNMDAPGLLVLPTHRVVHGLPTFDSAAMLQKAGQYFEIDELGASAPLDASLAKLRQDGNDRCALLAVTAGGSYLLKARPEQSSPALSGLSERQCALDVVQLHKLVLEEILEMSEDDVRNQSYLKYLRNAQEAAGEVGKGANVAFIMNPVKMEQVRDIAFNGEVLPQKSTDFYPKLLSGLTIYSLERP